MNSSSNFVSQQEPARGEARASSMNGSSAGGAAAQQQSIMGFAEPVPMLAQARFSKTFGVDHDVDVEIGMETADVHFEMKGMESLNRNFCPDATLLNGNLNRNFCMETSATATRASALTSSSFRHRFSQP